MSNKDVLEKAIQKAIDGGWKLKGWELVAITNGGRGVMYEEEGPHTEPDRIFEDVYSLIFNHDFAKALWGEAKPTRYEVFPDKDGDFPVHRQQGWQHHLMFMVIAEDPIAYLGANI